MVLSKILTAIRWYEPGMLQSERKLLFKLDLLILSYTTVSFFTKFLDVSALTNAYVSGMREDIGMVGNQLNYVNAVYESCYCVFQIPINLLLTRYPASFILPLSEFGWGLATLGTAFVKNYHQLMATRALLGLFAASNYIGCVYILSSWYKKKERGKRMAVFWIANPIGTAVGGWVEAAIYSKKGLPLASWRFLFIICSIITFVVSIMGFFTLPNFPHDIRSRFLTEDEKKLALERVESENIKTKRTVFSFKAVKRLALNWQVPLFALLCFTMVYSSYGSGTPFSLYLKSNDKLTVQQVNNIPTAANALALVGALSLGWYSDVSNDRTSPLLLVSLIATISNIILLIYDVSEGARYYAFFALGFCNGAFPLWQTWIGDTTFHDSELRAYAIAAGNVTGEVSSLIIPLILYKVTQAPKYKAGFIFSLILSILQILLVLVIHFLIRKYHSKYLAHQQSDEVTSPGSDKESIQNEKEVVTVEVSSV